MALRDINNEMIEISFKQFGCLGPKRMLALYGGGYSNKWHVRYDGRNYDQKLLLRGAHKLGGLGSLPSGKGTFIVALGKRAPRKPWVSCRFTRPTTGSAIPISMLRFHIQQPCGRADLVSFTGPLSQRRGHRSRQA